jgi:tetratricopeptide (TPR) repeat protein
MGAPMLKDAFQLHSQGRLAEAERAYSELLRREPRNFQVLHLLGVLAVQQGRPDRGIELMRKSLALESRQPLAQRDLGNALQQLNQLELALVCYDRALALKPDLADVHNNRGILLASLGRPGEALESYNRAIALKPDYAQAYNNRGAVLSGQNRKTEALADFDRAIALKPDYVKALNNRGAALADLERLDEALRNHERAIALSPREAQSYMQRGGVLIRLGRTAEALESYDRAITLDRGLAEAHDGRGTALVILKRPQEALESCDRALAINPNSANFHNNRGSALAALERVQEALECHDKAILLDPSSPTAISNRAAALSRLDRFEEALEVVDRAIAVQPGIVQAHINRGNFLAALKRYDDALKSFERAVALNPQSAEAHFGRSTMLLLKGHFEEGWTAYEWRKLRVGEAFNPRGRPVWSGKEDIAGKTLFVEAEQGLGDTIMFSRYVPMVADLGAHVVFGARDEQVRLFRSLDCRVELVPAHSPPSQFDYHVALASLPLAFGTKLSNIPANTPYVHAEACDVDKWRKIIGARGLKIGIAWQGSAYSRDRSFPLSCLAGIASLGEVRLISLQKGPGLEQLCELSRQMTVETLGPIYEAGDFAETAAVMEALDLVISCDTAAAHLAGALARPVWVALKDAAEWRWLSEQDDSPWYPGMRLFRQKARGDWDSVFAKMWSEMAKVAATDLKSSLELALRFR